MVLQPSCQHTCPLSSTAVLSTSAEHQSSLAMLPGMRLAVVLASPTQATLPWHVPSAANLQQQHIDAGTVVTSNNPYEHTLSHEEVQPNQPPSAHPRSTYVSRTTDTHDLQRDRILVTAAGKLASALGAIRARAGAAVVA